ncbi:unnamed protein product [Rhizopus stolonifer]
MQTGLPTPTPPPEPECYTKQINKIPLVTIFQRFLKELDGRDKMMKTIQYLLKILMHYKWAQAKHWSTITSQFSMTRKVLRLGNAIGPLKEFSKKNTTRENLFLLNETVNDLCDDLFCLYKLGWVNKKLGERAEVISAYCWFIGIMKDLNDNRKSLRKQQKSLAKKDEAIVLNRLEMEKKVFVTEISIVKLFMDGVFCACDIWPPSNSASVQAWSGFFSGLLAAYKLWIKFST